MTFNLRPSTSFPRRSFLTLAWKGLLAVGGVLGLGGLWRFLSYQPDPAPPTRFDLGDYSQYPVGSRTVIPEAEAVLVRNAVGFLAFSLVCPHLGCTVELSEDGYTCPCHRSLFNADGSLRRGPADRALRPLHLEVTPEAHLILHTD
jgi:nitrite reductase/ring-hydroxylating ferredoxin subunit